MLGLILSVLSLLLGSHSSQLAYMVDGPNASDSMIATSESGEAEQRRRQWQTVKEMAIQDLE